MDEKKKRMVMLLGSVFVLVIFITSYAGSGGGFPSSSGGNSSKNNTTGTQYPAFGAANAIVVGYGNSTTVRVVNSSASNTVTALMSAMQANGLITEYNPIGDIISVYLNRTSAYAMQSVLANMIASNTIAFSATEYVRLPATVRLTLASVQQSVPVRFPSSRYALQRSILDAPNSTVRVSISAEITYNAGSYAAVGNTTLRAG